MVFRSIPDWIRRHLSFISTDSVVRSACDISGLIEMSLGRELRLDNKLATSMALFNLISRGRGRSACSLYCPRRKQSRMLCEVISLSTCETADITLLRSCFVRSYGCSYAAKI